MKGLKRLEMVLEFRI